MMRKIQFFVAVLAFAATALAQSPQPSPDSQIRGFNAYESFRGTTDSLGAVLKLDSSFGYDFNGHMGIFTGIPLYLTFDRATPAGASSRQRAGVGDLYFGGDLYLPNPVADFTTTLTVATPTGSVADGFSTGHITADWSNRLRKRIGALAPFAVVGLSNSVPDTETLVRTFSSFGNLLHLEEGADLDLSQHAYVGASAYQIVPFGNQRIFDRVGDDLQSPAAEAGRNPGSTPDQPSATGTSITRENGFDAWIGFEPTRVIRTELGYSRSVTFAENRFSFTVSFNVGRMLRLRRQY
jgi:hypothetical protein